MAQPFRLAQPLLGFLFLSVFFSAICPATTKKPPLQPVNINTASSAELQQVPGIGPATADKILKMRKSYGAFKSVDDLLAIRGLGKKRLDKMRKYLTVGKPKAPSAARPATKPVPAAQKPSP
jgi:competence protein ComEA